LKILLIDGGRRERVESGYGRIAAALAEGLGPLGHTVIFTLEPEIDVCLYTSPPWSMRKVHVAGASRVGFTMHELEELQEGKQDWPDILNTLDLVLTPTEWNRSVWRRLGVRTPIEVVPLGVDPATYFPGTGHVCVMLAVHESLGMPDSRENWLDTLKAYYSAFTATDRVLLRIKTWKWDPEGFEAERLAQAGRRTAAELPPVEVIDATLSHAQMRALYLESTLFLKNANREGWSIPCTEALACGTQVAATRIEPLLSHLPAGTLWFTLGDWRGLGALLEQCYREFSADREERERYASSLTCQLVSENLERHFSPSP
jgi:glycosyltransferase involved in cell wall biosynthesis